MRGRDEKRLAILLRHWMEHNGDHADEFRSWAEKARKLGHLDVSEDIAQAAEQLGRANTFLRTALERLEGQ